ncbi:hypothetical protein DPMN_036314 [Dreissena polymorpha]|uniref:Uncharacterized protein n=1 Tax=Dreissena polymorpha TaxID=45954 RepID=A0A9D4RMY4_DREPO|nr:hypothetical protein DPMN_036314 [Dreissena polymorpha]
MKSSEQYIESLEKKLKKVKGLSSKDVKQSEMIRSLETCRHLQNSQYLASNDTMNDTVTVDEVTNSMFVAMQRKLNPEKQALNPLELLPLVEDDVLSKQTETQDGNLT